MSAPEFFISTAGSTPEKRVEFSELYPIKEDIKSILLLWDHNSYYVSVPDRYFIINGGRKVHAANLWHADNVRIEYARRNQADVAVAGGAVIATRVEYLVGLKNVDELDKVLLLRISEDGKNWHWISRR